MPSTKKLRLVLNDRAASDQWLRETVVALRAEGHYVDVRLLWESGDAQRYAAEGAAEGLDCIVAGGGDGTVNEVLNGILEAEAQDNCALGILPSGTANDFAKVTGIPENDPVAALRLILDGSPVAVDLGSTQGRHFINVASGGYVAEVTSEASSEVKKLLGGFSYFLTGLANASGLTARRTRLSGPEMEWEGDIFGFAVCNSRSAGGGFNIAPRAQLNDGLLDVLVIPDTPLKQMIRLIQELRQLPEQSPELLQYFQTPWLDVESPEGIQVNLDGEPLYDKRYHFEVRRHALQVYLPEETRQTLLV